MSTLDNVKWVRIENHVPDPPYERMEVKFPCVGDGAAYDSLSCTILVTTTEENEWGKLNLEMDCDGPPDNHWLAFELDCYGSIEEMLYIEDMDAFLLEHGIAPFQRFYIHLTASYWKDYWGEYDSEFDYEVLNIEPWDENRVCTEWEAYLARKRILMPWCPSV